MHVEVHIWEHNGCPCEDLRQILNTMDVYVTTYNIDVRTKVTWTIRLVAMIEKMLPFGVSNHDDIAYQRLL